MTEGNINTIEQPRLATPEAPVASLEGLKPGIETFENNEVEGPHEGQPAIVEPTQLATNSSVASRPAAIALGYHTALGDPSRGGQAGAIVEAKGMGKPISDLPTAA